MRYINILNVYTYVCWVAQPGWCATRWCLGRQAGWRVTRGVRALTRSAPMQPADTSKLRKSTTEYAIQILIVSEWVRFNVPVNTILPARRSKRGTCYGNVTAVVSITRRYCTKTAKPILKLFRHSGSTIILLSYDNCADSQFQGEPLQRGR